MGLAETASKTLVVLFDAPGQRRHAALPEGIHVSAGVHPLQDADGNQQALFHSAVWESAAELAQLPRYYIMGHLDKGMAETVRGHVRAGEIAVCKRLPDNETLRVQRGIRADRFPRGPQWYRCATSGCYS